MNSSTSCNPAILQKQNEETAVKKIEEANQKLQTIKKQRDDARTEHNKLRMEVEKLKLRESALNELIDSQDERESILKTECERICRELDDIAWKRKIIAVKQEMEKCNRKYYENLMSSIENVPADYMDVDEYRKKLEYEDDLKILRNKMEDLKSKITEKRKLDNECAKLLLEAQKSQKPHMRAIRMSTEKNLENIENLILKQEEELRNLLK